MVTLRTFTSAIEAALVKSHLQASGITCDLADENANLYGGGPLAMPVRLLVDENQVDEARELMATTPGLPHDFTAAAEAEHWEEETPESIASALNSVKRTNFWILLISIVSLLVSIYVLSELPRRTQSGWTAIAQARRAREYDRAIRLSRKFIAANPRDYYAYEYLGDILLESGRLKEAEVEFEHAYDLAPQQSLPVKLAKVREQLGRLGRDPTVPAESSP